jgi:hypothetical protein
VIPGHDNSAKYAIDYEFLLLTNTIFFYLLFVRQDQSGQLVEVSLLALLLLPVQGRAGQISVLSPGMSNSAKTLMS